MTNENLIVSRFKAVKAKGFVPSNRSNNTGIGKTFEDYMEVEENNIPGPDLAGFEIKSHRELSNSYITLFTKSPSFPRGANRYLRDNYGIAIDGHPTLKKLHTSMFANNFQDCYSLYSVMLINDRINRLLRIGIFSQANKKLIDSSCGYRYADIERVMNSKLKKLFYVQAECRHVGNVEHFRFDSADIYENPSFQKFLDMVDRGLIMFDIRIGSYQSGKNYGKAHDHGSGFRIKESNLHRLYSHHKHIE